VYQYRDTGHGLVGIAWAADLAGRFVCQKCKKAAKRPAAMLLQLAPRSRNQLPGSEW